MSEAVKDFFNQTHKYLHKEHGVMFRNYLVRKELGQISGKSILDCGCGNGQVTMNFLENNKVLFCFVCLVCRTKKLVFYFCFGHRKQKVLFIFIDPTKRMTFFTQPYPLIFHTKTQLKFKIQKIMN